MLDAADYNTATVGIGRSVNILAVPGGGGTRACGGRLRFHGYAPAAG